MRQILKAETLDYLPVLPIQAICMCKIILVISTLFSKYYDFNLVILDFFFFF